MLELKDKVVKLFALDGATSRAVPRSDKGFVEQADLESALLSLGYKPRDVEQVTVSLLKRLEREAPLETLIREALRS